MKRKTVVLMMATTLLTVGCATHVHSIGYGAQTGVKTTARQFYLLYGLVPLNTIDTNEMAGKDFDGNPITNYEIKTQSGPVDILLVVGLAAVTYGIGPAIIQTRTVTVTK